MRATGLPKTTIRQQSRRLNLFGVVGLVFVLILTSLPLILAGSAAATTRPGYNGKIAFYSDRDGNREIYTMSADGSEQTNATNSASYDIKPTWSPDGSKIAFATNRDENFEIYVMNADGSGLINLTNHPVTGDTNPVWSPDGSKILFESYRDGNWEIYSMNADGSEQARLTSAAETDRSPVWSPDGSQIAFESLRDGYWQVYIMNADGSGQTNITSSETSDGRPRWSPDGSRIVYESGQGDSWNIFVMNADGSDQTNITNTVGYYESNPRFSPDGSKIAFIRDSMDDWSYSALVIADVGSWSQQEYVFAEQGLQFIDIFEDYWSPDGKQLLLVETNNVFVPQDIYVVNADGTELTQITTGGTSGGGTWQSLPNTPPVVSDDTATAPFNTPTLVDVLANDSDEEALSGAHLTVLSQPSHGSASVIDGKVRYAPTLGHQGSDSFTYQICDSFMLEQKCSTGVVSLTVLAPTAPSLVVVNINGEHFSATTNKYTTSNLRPTFSGMATPGSDIKVEIHSDPIVLTTTADGNGNWSVTPSFDLPTGEHTVYISASLAGLTTTLDEFGLQIGTLANTGTNLWVVVTMAAGVVAGGTNMLARAHRTRVV